MSPPRSGPTLVPPTLRAAPMKGGVSRGMLLTVVKDGQQVRSLSVLLFDEGECAVTR
jgi:tRNA-binding EMAP/Myf-like protein